MALYKNAKLRNGKTADILVRVGKIAKIGAVSAEEASGEEVTDLGGNLVCEPYCDPHIHLDYVFTAQSFGENTTVMSLMNGVDSEEIIAGAVGGEHVLYSLIKVASHKSADGYHFDPETTIGIVFGEVSAPFESERVRAVNELFAGTGIHYRHTEHNREEIWSKFRLNIRNNLPQAIIGAGVGCYRDSAHMKAISDGLRSEVEAIAAAKGIDMSKADPSAARGSEVPSAARYSTLQDLDAGRHTEIDMFSGAMMRMGRELGIPTPYNEYTFHMIKALEEKNDGIFDYDDNTGKTSAS